MLGSGDWWQTPCIANAQIARGFTHQLQVPSAWLFEERLIRCAAEISLQSARHVLRHLLNQVKLLNNPAGQSLGPFGVICDWSPLAARR
jgi:hypothetical protein